MRFSREAVTVKHADAVCAEVRRPARAVFQRNAASHKDPRTSGRMRTLWSDASPSLFFPCVIFDNIRKKGEMDHEEKHKDHPCRGGFACTRHRRAAHLQRQQADCTGGRQEACRDRRARRRDEQGLFLRHRRGEPARRARGAAAHRGQRERVRPVRHRRGRRDGGRRAAAVVVLHQGRRDAHDRRRRHDDRGRRTL